MSRNPENSSLLSNWPLFKQFRDGDLLALGKTAKSERSDHLEPRIKNADRVVKSICPYCAVGCGQNVYVKDEKIVDIEGDPDSPISVGRLCPKGSATFQLVTGNHRVQNVLYRRPHGTEWEKIPLEQAMDMVAERVKKTRDENWQDSTRKDIRCTARLGIAHLGGATLDNEENYLIKKLFTASRHHTGRKPGPYLTLLHGPRSGGKLWKRRRNHVPAGSAERGLHCDRRLQHGRESPGRFPMGDEGQGAWRRRSSMSTRGSRAPARWPTSMRPFVPGPTSRSSAG